MSTAFLFPGQGSHFVGMGADLVASPVARHIFAQADAELGFSLSTLCFDGPEDVLTDTVNQQPALFVTSYATWQVMCAKGWDTPAYVAGHSLGELSALAVSGAMSFVDGLRLVRRRGELMQAAGERAPGAMAAILALDVALVAEICADVSEKIGRSVQIANDNCPGQIVISGDSQALDEAMKRATEAGARKVVKLPITIAAHSQLMQSAAAEFSKAVEATPVQAAQIPVIANATGMPITSPAEIRAELKAQLTSPVKWTDSINYLVGQGVDTFVEVGPGDVLLGLVKRIHRKSKRLKFKIDE